MNTSLARSSYRHPHVFRGLSLGHGPRDGTHYINRWRLLHMFRHFDPPFSGLWKNFIVSAPIFDLKKIGKCISTPIFHQNLGKCIVPPPPFSFTLCSVSSQWTALSIQNPTEYPHTSPHPHPPPPHPTPPPHNVRLKENVRTILKYTYVNQQFCTGDGEMLPHVAMPSHPWTVGGSIQTATLKHQWPLICW